MARKGLRKSRAHIPKNNGGLVSGAFHHRVNQIHPRKIAAHAAAPRTRGRFGRYQRRLGFSSIGCEASSAERINVGHCPPCDRYRTARSLRRDGIKNPMTPPTAIITSVHGLRSIAWVIKYRKLPSWVNG